MALTLLILVVYAQVVSFDFVNFDDDDYGTDNRIVKDGITAAGTHWAFTSASSSNWHPLTWLSHMLDCQIYGLAAGVWTQNIRRAMVMADQLEAGTVWVNTYRAVSYMSPFGGYKRSGLGRESGQEMIKEYLQQKCVWISTATEVPNPFVLR